MPHPTDVTILPPFGDVIYLSPIFTLFIIIGILFAIKRIPKYAFAVFFGWILLPYIFHAGIPYQNIRYIMMVVPAIAIFIALGIDSIGTLLKNLKFIAPLPKNWGGESRNVSGQLPSELRPTGGGDNLNNHEMGDNSHHRGGIIPILLITIALLGLGHMAQFTHNHVHDFIEIHQRDKRVAQWAKDIIPEGERLYTFGLTLTLQTYTDLEVLEIFYESPNLLNQRWQRGNDDYLLLNVWVIENQWQGQIPQINYHWFRDTRGLTQIARNGNYTLFRIDG